MSYIGRTTYTCAHPQVGAAEQRRYAQFQLSQRLPGPPLPLRGGKAIAASEGTGFGDLGCVYYMGTHDVLAHMPVYLYFCLFFVNASELRVFANDHFLDMNVVSFCGSIDVYSCFIHTHPPIPRPKPLPPVIP